MAQAAALSRTRKLQLSPTLSYYIARQYAAWLLSALCFVCSVIFLVSLVDLLDRFADKEKASFSIVLEFAALRLPFFALEVLPFTILSAGMLTFWKLTRTNELVVARSAGVSVWQFLWPAIATSLLVGIISVTVINPLSSVFLSHFEQQEARYLKNETSLLTVAQGGLWLRQAEPSGQSVIYAKRADQLSMTLYEVMVLQYEGEDEFVRRLDAESATLGKGVWVLSEVSITQPGQRVIEKERLELTTPLTERKILESFSPPETISFWALPAFIQLLEDAGFSAQRHRLQFNKLLATPLLFVAMVLLAATFSMRNQRRGKVTLVILAGVLTAFLLYFLSNFVYALGLSGKLPVSLAAWTPSGVSTLLGLALLLHLEDG